MTTPEKKDTCATQVYDSMKSRMLDLKILYRPNDCENDEIYNFLANQGHIFDEKIVGTDELHETVADKQNEYGLCFDYVAAETFADQDEGFFRYQISYGGPSEEIRFYTDAAKHLTRVEFWYLDWFDGAHEVLKNDELETAQEIFRLFDECGTIDAELEKAANG